MARPSSAASVGVECAELRVLEKAREGADRDVSESRRAVEKAELQDVEAQEARQRRQREVERAGAAAARVQLRRLERRIAILLRDVRVDRFGRRVQEIARE